MTPIDQDTITTPLIQTLGQMARDLEAASLRVTALIHTEAFLRQVEPAELAGVRAAAAAARSAGVDIALTAAALHHRALIAGDCGHGYLVSDSCLMCDDEADELRHTTEQLLGLDQPAMQPTAYQGTQAPTTCPSCGAVDQWSAAAGLVLVCTACGYRDEMPEAAPQPARTKPDPAGR